MLVDHFRDFCRSEHFNDHCVSMGFKNTSFKESTFLDGKWPGYQKFASALEQELPSKCDVGATGPGLFFAMANRRLGLVFHGTREENVLSILKNGLDANLRQGQAYGPGEYFATSPTTAVSYCKGGKQMVVFVVIIPVRTGKSSNAPESYVVVNNNDHHLAIGTLCFDSVDSTVLAESEAKRQAFLKLSKEVLEKSRVKKEAETKALIMKHLIANNIDWASEIYVKKGLLLGHTSRSEIAWYANSKLDEDVVEAYFPHLPEPIEKEATVQSLDVAAKVEQEAATKLEHARAEFYKSKGLRAAEPPVNLK